MLQEVQLGLQSLERWQAYAPPERMAELHGAGLDARWVVIEGPPAFFRVTKRLHRALHGESEGALPLTEEDRRLDEETLLQNALELAGLVLPRDPHDLLAFAHAVHLLLDAPQEAKEMGERARMRVRERDLGLASLLRDAALLEQVVD